VEGTGAATEIAPIGELDARQKGRPRSALQAPQKEQRQIDKPDGTHGGFKPFRPAPVTAAGDGLLALLSCISAGILPSSMTDFPRIGKGGFLS